MAITKQQIIDALKMRLQENPLVYALWLEGSDSIDSSDEYSDIDIVADVKDGNERVIFEEIEKILSEISELDFNYEGPRPNKFSYYKIFHLKNSPEHLLIDVNIQSHSRNFVFTKENKYEQPLILFDKIGAIKFKTANAADIEKGIRNRLPYLEAAFHQRSKVKKYILRKKYLEAIVYYHKNVLHPLVELLRLKYTPLNSDYHLIHITDHLPTEVVEDIENLYKTFSVEEIAEKLPIAERLFSKTIQELKNK